MVKVINCLLLFNLFFLSSIYASNEINEGAIRTTGLFDYMNIKVLKMNKDLVSDFYIGEEWFDKILDIGVEKQKTPYTWGGNSWETGIDCSHFTQKIFNEVGLYYRKYMTTLNLKNVTDANGLIAVDKEDMRPGDLLIYGKISNDGKWIGHVLILIDPNYQVGPYKGLFLGSQSGKVGVTFIGFKGFPKYYRFPWMKFRKVLRLKDTM